MDYYLISIIALFVFIVAMIKRSKNNKIRNIQLEGIHYITELKPLISLVQQHRGLTNAWLNGDNEALPKLSKLKNEIKIKMDKLSHSELSTNERWISFNDHWHRIINYQNKALLVNSFEQHCLLIKNLSYLLEDTSETYLLTAEYCSELPNIGYTWRELVLSAENIGQARAIGTSVCVQKYCSSVDKIRLNYLSENINKMTNSTLYKLHYLPEEVNKHDDKINIAVLKMDELIHVITKELVNCEIITLDHQSYFDLATSTIAAFDDIFNHQVEQIKKLI